MKCLIIDDEPLAREILEGYIHETPGLEVLASCKSAAEALPHLNNKDLAVLFLDIKMPRLDGLQFLEVVQPNVPVVLTTAYQEHALKSYDYNVSDYLLKPILYPRFLQAIQKIQQGAESTNQKDFIFVKSEYKVHRVNLNDIQFIEGMKDYLIIQTTQQKLLSLMSFSDIEPFLKVPDFVRIHKSYIIALKHIDSLEKSLVNISDRQIPIGKTYRQEFLRIIDQFKAG